MDSSASSDLSHYRQSAAAQNTDIFPPNFWLYVYRKAYIYLGTDLVATLASLDVYDFTHFVDVFYNVPHKLAMTEL